VKDKREGLAQTPGMLRKANIHSLNAGPYWFQDSEQQGIKQRKGHQHILYYFQVTSRVLPLISLVEQH
jgi:hypothetical protein